VMLYGYAAEDLTRAWLPMGTPRAGLHGGNIVLWAGHQVWKESHT